MPRAHDFPRMTVATEVTLCTHNPLGAKGCGEVGAIGSPPAVINAVVDALRDYGVRHLDMPASPEKIWAIIQANQPRLAAENGTPTRCMISRSMPPPPSRTPVKALGADMEAKLLAGGQTFIPVLKQRLNKPSALIDLNKAGLAGITATADKITIGAMTTHHAIMSNPDIQARIPGLAKMASWIGDTQVRHRRHDGRLAGQ